MNLGGEQIKSLTDVALDCFSLTRLPVLVHVQHLGVGTDLYSYLFFGVFVVLYERL